MFRKVFKYDMASIKRYWWMIAVVILAMSVLGSFVFRVMYTAAENMNEEDGILLSLIVIAGSIFVFICIIAAFSSVIVTTVMTHLRYYRNFFTDEGYLTFTLPVRRKTLYLSKTVNSMLWAFAHVLLLVVAAAIALTLAPVPEDGQFLNLTFWNDFFDSIAEAWDQIGAWLIVYVLEFLLMYLCASAASVGLIQLCITIGSIVAKKHKLLASIGIYYAVNMITSTVAQIAAYIVTIFMSTGIAVLAERATALEGYTSIALALMLLTLIFAAFAMILHFVALGLVERKLNLA